MNSYTFMMKPQTHALLLGMVALLCAGQDSVLEERLKKIAPYALHEESIEEFKTRLLCANTWSEEDGEGKVVYTMVEGDGTRGRRLFIEKESRLYMVEASHEETDAYEVYEIEDQQVRFLIEFREEWFKGNMPHQDSEKAE